MSGQLPPTSTAATSKEPAAHCCATGITIIVVRRDCHCYQHRHVTPRAVRVQAIRSSCGWRWWCCCCQPILVTDGAGAAASLVVMLTALVLLVVAGRHRPRLSSFRRCSSSSSLLHGVLPTSRTAMMARMFSVLGRFGSRANIASFRDRSKAACFEALSLNGRKTCLWDGECSEVGAREARGSPGPLGAWTT